MSTVKEYLEHMSSEELQGILRGHCFGTIDLPIDTILFICQILHDRNPAKPDAAAAFRRFLKYYLESEK